MSLQTSSPQRRQPVLPGWRRVHQALAEADELLTSKRLERILRFHGGGLPVVSMYLALAPAPGDVHANAVTKVDSLLHEIRALEEDRRLDHDTRMSLRGDIETIKEVVERSVRTPGALAIISCSGKGALELVRVPRTVRDRIMVDETPWVRPLLAVLEEHRRCFAVVIDRERAHTWELYLGQIRDHGPLVAAALDGLVSADRGEILAIGGHGDELAHFVEELPRPLRERVAGTFAIDHSAARNAGSIQAHAQEILESYELDQQRQSVANVLGRAAAGRLAVVGLDACLWAGSVAAVQALYVQDGTIRPGVVCDRSRWFAASGQSCPVCGAEMRRTPDVINELTETVIDEGGSVFQVRAETELSQQLLACSLRFELPDPG